MDSFSIDHRFFVKLIPDFDIKTVLCGLKAQRIQRKTSENSQEFASNKTKSNCRKELVSEEDETE